MTVRADVPRVAVVIGLAGLLVAITVTAAPADAVRDRYGGAGDDDPRAVRLLERSAAAMRTTAYSGTRMVSAWGSTSATTALIGVRHVPGQGTRLFLRGGDIPGDAATTFLDTEGRGPGRSDPLDLAYFDLLTESYALALGRRDSVAGRSARVVRVERAGDVAARLWVDDRSAVLLRREVFDRGGRLVRESTFIDIDVRDGGFLSHLPPTTPAPAGHPIGPESRYALQSAGWTCASYSGAMQLVDIETLDGTDALHLTYSDGLSRMSVFEQRGSLDAGALSGFRQLRLAGEEVHVREGLPTYVLWEDDGLVFTAVTDGPLDTVVGVVAADSSGSSPDRGFWDRVSAGLTRLAGWASPLV